MASTAHKDPAQVVEHYDAEDVLAEKVHRLAELVRRSKHFVIFTGAGISTSAGIGDFRGPNGKWTCEAQGRPVPKGVDSVNAFPTPTHMSIVELQRRGILKYLVSQNCDGLHRRSGFPAAAISELHGNGNVEICEDCGMSYFRDFKCQRMGKGYDHFTGRFCVCNGRLLNSTIDFGQNLPPGPLQLATAHSKLADLHLALGSSLTVTPAADMPRYTKQRGGVMVICNLQRTPLTDKADFQIFAKTDTVMTMLMDRLAVPVPPFRLLRRVVASQPDDGEEVSLKAVDIHNPKQEVGVVRAVDWDGSGLSKRDADRSASSVACRYGGYTWPATTAGVVKPTLHFVGHYGEPPYTLNLNFTKSRRLDMILSFDPVQSSWEMLEPEQGLVPSPLIGGGKQQSDESLPPNWYGLDHRDYCVSSWVHKHGKSQAEAEAIVERKFEESKLVYKLHSSSAVIPVN